MKLWHEIGSSEKRIRFSLEISLDVRNELVAASLQLQQLSR